MPTPEVTLQHYPYEVIKRLCAYMVEPKADPTEALLLYLTMAYGLSSWELRHAQIPATIMINGDTYTPPLADAYHIIVPKPSVSRGRRSPGRPDEQLIFRVKDERWLKPLLERFEHRRQQTLVNRNNRFLYVTPDRSQYGPVSKMSITRILNRASSHVLGALCNIRTLRQTAAIIFTDRMGASILPWMGWNPATTTTYEFAKRKEISPRPLG
jgi:hypothetical protein